MWDAEAHVGRDMEKEVSVVQEFFRPALDKGARFLCHDNTVPSAQTILQEVFQCWPDGGDGYVTKQQGDDEVDVKRSSRRPLPAPHPGKQQRQVSRREALRQAILEDNMVLSSCWGWLEA